MGFLNNLFGKKEFETNNTLGFLNPTETVGLDDYKISLDKVTVNLTKSTGIQFDNLKSKVKLVIDYSGSMDNLYRNGTVQQVITKLLPLALKFDDDGELECFLFSNGYCEVKSCNAQNYTNYVNNIIYNANFSMGGTEYSPVLNAIHNADTKNIPTFTIFITDGDNYDKSETDAIIRKISIDNGFIMFVGIGNDNFSYLNKLDNLSGRPIDNTGFVKFSDIGKVDETTLYNKLLKEYATWLKGNQR